MQASVFLPKVGQVYNYCAWKVDFLKFASHRINSDIDYIIYDIVIIQFMYLAI